MNVEQLEARITELEKQLKKKERENSRLLTAIEQEKIYANAKANLVAAQTLAQRARDRYLDLLLKNTRNNIMCYDESERIVFCSDVLLKLSGIQNGDEGGKTIGELLCGVFDNNFISLLSKNLSEVIAENESRSVPLEAMMENTGILLKYIVNFIPMSSSGTGHEGAMMIFNDVTDIEHAREEAILASHAKSEFLSNMSHEMRTPMNAIIGMTAIAKESESLERKEYCLKKIEDASTHLLGVINDILDMSKIEANKLELSLEKFNFESMIQKVVNVISFRVNEKKQNFLVNLDNSIPNFLIGDDQRLSQIITNLLSNAVKFTPEKGEIRLESRLLGIENNNCKIQIDVIDTGIGINQKTQESLFSSFRQADSGTSRKYGGTGLGLAISRRLVEIMDGRIWIESEPGKGSKFSFTFSAEQTNEIPENELIGNIGWNNVRLLVVDDTQETLEYFSSEAARLKIYCDIASSGEAALELISKNGSYDIYIIDWKMPGMDGIQLAEQINKLNPENTSMIIMISAADWSYIENDAKKAGIEQYLQKPVFRSDLVNCLNKCFGINRQQVEQAKNMADDFSGFDILLVEDVEINREIVLALLEPTKINIDCAENGIIAVNMFKEAKKPYDMIFMDMQMPEMDGLEATRLIRQYENNTAMANGKTLHLHVPIVAMTANVFREDVERCIAAGMDSHLGKPLDFGEVLEKLRLYLPASI